MSFQEELGYKIPYIGLPGVTHAGIQIEINEPILTQTLMFISEGNWEKANEYVAKLFDIYPESGFTYLCKLMVDLKIKFAFELFLDCNKIYESQNYKKFLTFGEKPLKIFVANEALNFLFVSVLSFADKLEQQKIKHTEIIKQVKAWEIDLKNIRNYYDMLTQTQGEYLNNVHFTHTEAIIIGKLISLRIYHSTHTTEQSAIKTLLEYAKYPEDSHSYELLASCLVQQSNKFLEVGDYRSACHILSFIPNYKQNADIIQNQAHTIIEKLSRLSRINSQTLKEYRSSAICELLRYPINNEKTANLVLKHLRNFELDPSAVSLSSKRLVEYNPYIQDLDIIIWKNSQKLREGYEKKQCLDSLWSLKNKIKNKSTQ